MKIESMFDNIMCERIELNNNKSAVRSITTKESSLFVTVVNVGSNVLCVEPGDKLLIKKFSGTEVKIDNKEFLFITKNDILAKIKD